MSRAKLPFSTSSTVIRPARRLVDFCALRGGFAEGALSGRRPVLVIDVGRTMHERYTFAETGTLSRRRGRCSCPRPSRAWRAQRTCEKTWRREHAARARRRRCRARAKRRLTLATMVQRTCRAGNVPAECSAYTISQSARTAAPAYLPRQRQNTAKIIDLQLTEARGPLSSRSRDSCHHTRERESRTATARESNRTDRTCRATRPFVGFTL